MTLNVMPYARPPQFITGGLTLRSTAAGAVTLGNPSEDRWVVVQSMSSSGGGIGTFTPATLNGTAMNLIVEDYTYAYDDGRRTAFWASKLTQGTTCTITAPGNVANYVWTLTGVRTPLTSVILGSDGTGVATSGNVASLGTAMENFGSASGITNMVPAGSFSYPFGNVFAVNARGTSPVTYSLIAPSRIVLFRTVSWVLNY